LGCSGCFVVVQFHHSPLNFPTFNTFAPPH
jgi:hypothetical protein